jgi:hypothetical protein
MWYDEVMAERATTTTLTISLPNQVVSSLRAIAGKRGVSGYITDAVSHQLALDRLAEIVDEFESTHPPLTEAEIQIATETLFGARVDAVAA